MSQNKWISVKKQLPPNNNEVFITDGESCASGWYKKSDERWILDDDLFEASNYDGYCHISIIEEITHWMGIPELPKERYDEPE